MNQILEVRQIERSEISWVNKCYDEVEFVHSNYEKEIIAVAEWDGQKAGVGRLVTVDEKNLELGGMYVFQSFRGKGIARGIVTFLLTHVQDQTVYCIPFEHLVPFYQQCGFVHCTSHHLAPKELLNKYFWCKEKYTCSTSLLVLEKFLLN